MDVVPEPVLDATVVDTADTTDDDTTDDDVADRVSSLSLILSSCFSLCCLCNCNCLSREREPVDTVDDVVVLDDILDDNDCAADDAFDDDDASDRESFHVAPESSYNFFSFPSSLCP